MQWGWQSIALVLLGLVINYSGWEMNKQLWSPSYLFFMAGCTGAFLSLFYILMDFTTWQPKFMQQQRKLLSLAWRVTDVV